MLPNVSITTLLLVIVTTVLPLRFRSAIVKVLTLTLGSLRWRAAPPLLRYAQPQAQHCHLIHRKDLQLTFTHLSEISIINNERHTLLFCLQNDQANPIAALASNHGFQGRATGPTDTDLYRVSPLWLPAVCCVDVGA